MALGRAQAHRRLRLLFIHASLIQSCVSQVERGTRTIDRFCLGIFPVLGLTLAVIGAGLGALTTHRAGPNDPV